MRYIIAVLLISASVTTSAVDYKNDGQESEYIDMVEMSSASLSYFIGMRLLQQDCCWREGVEYVVFSLHEDISLLPRYRRDMYEIVRFDLIRRQHWIYVVKLVSYKLSLK